MEVLVVLLWLVEIVDGVHDLYVLVRGAGRGGRDAQRRLRPR